MTRNFAWGDTIAVRQALISTLPARFFLSHFSSPLTGSVDKILSMGYPPHDGDPELIDLVKEVARAQVGSAVKHLFITNGCTGALNVSLSAMKKEASYGVFGDTYFPFYPQIVSGQGLITINYDQMDSLLTQNKNEEKDFIVILDSPSNPEGIFRQGEADIWDAAYASHKYGGKKEGQPLVWKAMCGSLSKTLGVNGIRLGWVATDDDAIAEELRASTTREYCGISQLQQDLAKSILKNLDQANFEAKAKSYIDDNREEWARVARRFGQLSGNTGMFQILRLGKAETKALNKAGVIWQQGNSWGKDSSWARISLGQDRVLTKETVKDVLS